MEKVEGKYAKKFSFLTKHSYFKETKKEFEDQAYYYSCKEGGINQRGQLCTDSKLRTIYWFFEEENEDKYSKSI